MAATLTQDRFVGRDWVVRAQVRQDQTACVQTWIACAVVFAQSPSAEPARRGESGCQSFCAARLPRLQAHWVRPETVVQVAFIEWTVHGKLRHPRLLGVRPDKDARQVTREQP
jgi:hypothetical protein